MNMKIRGSIASIGYLAGVLMVPALLVFDCICPKVIPGGYIYPALMFAVLWVTLASFVLADNNLLLFLGLTAVSVIFLAALLVVCVAIGVGTGWAEGVQ